MLQQQHRPSSSGLGGVVTRTAARGVLRGYVRFAALGDSVTYGIGDLEFGDLGAGLDAHLRVARLRSAGCQPGGGVGGQVRGDVATAGEDDVSGKIVATSS